MTHMNGQPQKPLPKKWPRISSSLFYDDASKAIDWLCSAFGFAVRLRIEGDEGQIEHSELDYGDGLIMVSSVKRHAGEGSVVPSASPGSVGGKVTQALCIVVDDADAHCAAARAAGATIVDEPATHDYGDDYWVDRTYRAVDLEGHHWWFMQRVRDQNEPR